MNLSQKSKRKITRIDLINTTLRIYTQSGNIVDILLDKNQIKQAYWALLHIELNQSQSDALSG